MARLKIQVAAQLWPDQFDAIMREVRGGEHRSMSDAMRYVADEYLYPDGLPADIEDSRGKSDAKDKRRSRPKRNHTLSVERRARALMMKARGDDVATISGVLNIGERTVRRYLQQRDIY